MRATERDASRMTHAVNVSPHRPHALNRHSIMAPQQRSLGSTGFTIAPLVLGTNVFGWTIDEPTSFSVLDAFVDAGFNAIDTADVYSRWAPGNSGGESEAIIGRWLKRDPSRRDRVRLLTKVGGDMRGRGRKDLSKAWIREAVEDSLRRLQVETIDLYQAHWPDPATPYEETLSTFAELMQSGKVRAIGASNHDASQLAEALRVADERRLPRYATLQPLYNLYDRGSYDGALRDLAIRERLGVIPYYGLASGFLTGKYRSHSDLSKSPRGGGVARYLDERGMRILAALDEVGRRHSAQPAEVALAWLMQRDGVTAPIASATSREQLASLVHAAELRLSPEDVATLDDASAEAPLA
ncbi:MAG: NADP-dependent aryl-alcohol dehydrogenase [Gemmatimonadetes bacterium]|nr:NADP-dependent aryl-alcohol dehydrogenase [Gemmatimonadota bacterium]